jgi:hypothetical protein
MREVHWATDARLDRKVASKVLPKAFTKLIRRLCARADRSSLALLLPPYLGGGAANRTRLLTALQMVHASRSLEGEDLSVLDQAIGELNGV